MLAIAHRGYSSRFPENTRRAFDGAIAAGANYVETDLRLSRDGAVVCLHDPDLMRIAGRPDKVADLDASVLAEVPVGGGETVSILDDVLDLVDGRIGLVLDVKIATAAMLERVLATLAGRANGPQVVYGARSLDHLDALRRRDSALPVLALVSDYDRIPEFLTRGVMAVRLWEEDITDERIQAVRVGGCQVWVTAGRRSLGEKAGDIDEARLARLSRWGIDGVLINDPTLVAGGRTRCGDASPRFEL